MISVSLCPSVTSVVVRFFQSGRNCNKLRAKSYEPKAQSQLFLLVAQSSKLAAKMPREYPDRPLIGVGAIIIENNSVVLVKRAHPPIQGQWSIPGGVLEVGELIREAAVREAREETGLIVEPGELLGVFDRILRDPDKRVQYHYVLIDFLCRRIGGELQAASDATEVRWFKPEELPALNLAEDTLEVIQKGLETSTR